MPLNPSADIVFADGPQAAPYQPEKPAIRRIFKQVEQAVDAFSAGAGSIAKATKAQLDGDLAHAADVTAWVYNDATAANNGIYRKSGASGAGSWTRILDLPFSFIVASNPGAGTPNAIQATTSMPVSSSALVILPLAATNTASPVTVKFNGGSALTIKTNSGNNVASGGLVAGMLLLGIISGSTFRLVSDQVSAAIVAAAEAAQAAAEAAAASINQRIYTAVSNAISDTIPVAVKRLQTQFFSPNYAVPATLVGGARYRRVSLADLTGVPTQAYFRSADRFMPDGTTSSTNGGYWLLDEAEINWTMLGVVPDGDLGNDDTVPAQAAIDFAILSSTVRKLVLNGTVTVSKLVVAGGNGLVIEADNCIIVANSLSAQTALLEVKSPNTHILGRLVLNCKYKTNYACGFWHWHETQSQFSRFTSIVVTNSLIGHRIGNISYPGSILSEVVSENPQTYGCPVAMEVVGGETYVTVSNPQLSADAFGGDASWSALVKVGVRNKGATVMVNGGEVLLTSATDGVLFRHEPIDRGAGRVEWGSINVSGTVVETASTLAILDNIGLTINNTASGRRGYTGFHNISGYHSQDINALIYVKADYDDFVDITSPNLWKNGSVRTQPNVFCEGGSTAEIRQLGDFGPGFQVGLAGIQGGRTIFSRRDILRGKKLNGQAFTASSGFQTALFQNADNTGDKGRFLISYSAGTGVFTVPEGGLEDVVVMATLRMTDAVTGDARLMVTGTEIARSRMVNGCAQIVHSLGNMASGATIKIEIDVDTNTTGLALDDCNVFCVNARRGMA